MTYIKETQFAVREFKYNQNKVEADYYILEQGKITKFSGCLFRVSG